MKASLKHAGATTPSQFRLGPDTLAKLDRLVADFTAESGSRETRSSVLRQLVHREAVRRARPGEAAKNKSRINP